MRLWPGVGLGGKTTLPFPPFLFIVWIPLPQILLLFLSLLLHLRPTRPTMAALLLFVMRTIARVILLLLLLLPRCLLTPEVYSIRRTRSLQDNPSLRLRLLIRLDILRLRRRPQ